MQQLFSQVFDPLPEMGKIIKFFRDMPLLKELIFVGETFIDDSELLSSVDSVTFNGKKFNVDEWNDAEDEDGSIISETITEDGRKLPEKYSWMLDYLWECREFGFDLITLLAKGDTVKVEIKFTRKEVEAATPIYNILENFKALCKID